MLRRTPLARARLVRRVSTLSACAVAAWLLATWFAPAGSAWSLASPGAISFSQSDYGTTEGAGAAAVTLTRTGGADGAVTAKITLADVTTAPADYSVAAPGQLDESFISAQSFGLIYRNTQMILQPDGKVIVGDTSGVWRLKPDGTRDDFAAGFSGATNNAVVSLALQPDGKVIIGGYFTSVLGVARNRVARLNANGTLDTTFDPGVGPDQDVDYVALQPDGKILIAGFFNSVGGVSRQQFARLNADGSLDQSYTYPKFSVSSLLVQPDGKALVSNGTLERVNTDGTLDQTFTPPAASVSRAALLPDGKILISGNFTQVNGNPANKVARLNADGSFDATFNAGAGPNEVPFALTPQPDGKVLVGGFFNLFDGRAVNEVVRLNADGTLDTTFSGPELIGAGNYVASIAVRPDGKIMLGGTYFIASPTTGPRQNIARIHGDIFVSWADGDAADKTVSVGVADDLLDEPDEQLALTVTPITGGATVGANPTARLNIVDNDVPPSITSAPPPAVITRGEFFVHPFKAAGHPASALSVTAGVLPPGLALGPNGELFGVPTLNGNFNNITVTASNGVAPSASQTFNIRVNAPPASFSDSYNVNEDSELSVAAPGVLSNDADEDGEPMTAVLVGGVSNGTLDFKPDGSFTYKPPANFSGPVTFFYRATDGLATGLFATAQINVAAVNDAPVNVVPGAQATAENTSRIFSAMTGNRVGVNDLDVGFGAVRVTLAAVGGTATLGGTGGLTFSAGDGTADSLMTFSGSLATVNVALNGMRFNPAAGFSGAATLQITTNDLGNTGSGGQLTDVDSIPISILEGGALRIDAIALVVAERAGAATVTVARTGGSAGAASINYATSDGTASAGSDYTAASGTLNFAAGETSKSFSIQIADDAGSEADETINVTLSGVAGSGSLGSPATVVLTVLNDDAPFVQFAVASYQKGEQEGRATITVVRTGDVSGPATAQFETVDDPAAVPCDPTARQPDGTPYPKGAAYARCDYATTVETLSWAAGDAQPKTISIPLVDDAHVEGVETLTLRVTSAVGTNKPLSHSVTLTIQDNDSSAGANPINGNRFFVRMQYLDFLSREPETGEPWTKVLDDCPNVNNTDGNSPSAGCDRIRVSQSFFQAPEFSLKGLYVYLFHRVAYARIPSYAEIVPDMRAVTGQTPQEVFDKRAAFAQSFPQRADFKAAYDGLSNAQYVSALLDPYGLQQITTESPQDFEGAAQVVLTRQQLIDALNNNSLTRAQVLRAVVQSNEIDAAEYQGAFVAMQYYGYLRRTPEPSGYEAWLRVIKRDPNDVRLMIDGFVNSQEYKLRFGQL